METKSNTRIRSKSLYRKAGLAVIFTLLLGMVISASVHSVAQAAQEEQGPEITPQEKKPKKKGRDPRAVGLLQLTPNGKATLIPIAILIDGRFYDASAYKAAPVPMVLETGTVYEAMRTGNSLGLFTVIGALHSKDSASQNPWIGTGTYLPTGTEAAKSTRKAENVPLGLEDKDAPPRLGRAGTGASKPATPSSPASPGQPDSPPSAGKDAGASTDKPAASAPSSSTPESTPKTSGGSTSESGQRGSSQPESSTSGPNQGGSNKTGSSKDGSAQSGATQPAQAPPDSPRVNTQSSGTESAGDQPANRSQEAEHPTLRRGKPTQPLPDDESKSEKAPAATSAATKEASTAKNTNAKTAAELIPAISDVAGPDPRPYVFFWPKGEEDERRKQMLSLAVNEVQAYLTAQAKGQIEDTSGEKQAPTARRKTTKRPQPVLEHVQLRAYDLWGNNDPVLILSAEARLPPASKKASSIDTWKEEATAAPTDSAGPVNQYTITLVARTDIYSNLRTLYSGVTDKYHLDVTPRLELIDAVDADGDGRGELLFRETSDIGTGYVIYRATADKLWKMFDSLNQE